MEVGKQFADLNQYVQGMTTQKVLNDKLFFFDELDQDVFSNCGCIVDFGCADGVLLTEIYSRMHNKIGEDKDYRPHLPHGICKYIGYDISEEMIKLANEKFPYDSYSYDLPYSTVRTDITFTSNWEEVKADVDKVSKEYNRILILSSVIHEVFAYMPEKEIDVFFNRILNECDFTHIIIRDMMVSNDIVRVSNPKDVEKILANFTIPIDYRNMAAEYQNVWGSLNHNKNLVHFLLKYKWIVNWERELHENYFGITLEDFLEEIKNRSNDKYQVSYLKRFCPLKSSIKKTFDIDIVDDTHIKLIFTKKNLQG